MAVESDLKSHRLPELIQKQSGNLQRPRHSGKVGGGIAGVGLKSIQGAKK